MFLPLSEVTSKSLGWEDLNLLILLSNSVCGLSNGDRLEIHLDRDSTWKGTFGTYLYKYALSDSLSSTFSDPMIGY